MSNNNKSKSKYARKLRMKMGGGKYYIGWQWWTQADGAPTREATTVKPNYRPKVS